MRVSKAILTQVEVARGSQRLSMGRCWEDFHHVLCVILYFGTFCCIKGFVHHGCSVALHLLFSGPPPLFSVIQLDVVHVAFLLSVRSSSRQVSYSESFGLVCCDGSSLLTCGGVLRPPTYVIT